MGENNTHMQMPPSPSLSDSEEHLTLTAVIERVWTKKGERPIADGLPAGL